MTPIGGQSVGKEKQRSGQVQKGNAKDRKGGGGFGLSFEGGKMDPLIGGEDSRGEKGDARSKGKKMSSDKRNCLRRCRRKGKFDRGGGGRSCRRKKKKIRSGKLQIKKKKKKSQKKRQTKPGERKKGKSHHSNAPEENNVCGKSPRKGNVEEGLWFGMFGEGKRKSGAKKWPPKGPLEQEGQKGKKGPEKKPTSHGIL